MPDITPNTFPKSRVIGATMLSLTVLFAGCSSSNSSSASTSTSSKPAQQSQHVFETAHFADGAIVDGTKNAACTLNDGAKATCATFTIAGYPTAYSTGPFCPTTITTPASEAGIWFDGNGTYDLTGEFIKNLATFYNDNEWHMYDSKGNINVTDTREAFLGAARPDVDPKYQNFCVEGRLAWLTNGEAITKTVSIPTKPVLTSSSPSTNPGDWGVTLDGVVIAASAPVSAILGAHTIASFDKCGGHFNNAEGYHMHASTGCGTLDDDHISGETAMFGYAMDGFPIHLPLKASKLKAAKLDECGGHSTPGLGYHYHANSPSKNSVLTCLKGQFVAVAGDRGGPPGGATGGPPVGQPNLSPPPNQPAK